MKYIIAILPALIVCFSMAVLGILPNTVQILGCIIWFMIVYPLGAVIQKETHEDAFRAALNEAQRKEAISMQPRPPLPPKQPKPLS